MYSLKESADDAHPHDAHPHDTHPHDTHPSTRCRTLIRCANLIDVRMIVTWFPPFSELRNLNAIY